MTVRNLFACLCIVVLPIEAKLKTESQCRYVRADGSTSKPYSLTVDFLSGHELQTATLNFGSYETFSCYAAIWFGKGEAALVKLDDVQLYALKFKDFSSYDKMTARLNDPANPYFSGRDQQGRLWRIYPPDLRSTFSRKLPALPELPELPSLPSFPEESAVPKLRAKREQASNPSAETLTAFVIAPTLPLAIEAGWMTGKLGWALTDKPKNADIVLVALRTDLVNPLGTEYDSISDLKKSTEKLFKLDGANFIIYTYVPDGDILRVRERQALKIEEEETTATE